MVLSLQKYRIFKLTFRSIKAFFLLLAHRDKLAIVLVVQHSIHFTRIFLFKDAPGPSPSVNNGKSLVKCCIYLLPNHPKVDWPLCHHSSATLLFPLYSFVQHTSGYEYTLKYYISVPDCCCLMLPSRILEYKNQSQPPSVSVLKNIKVPLYKRHFYIVTSLQIKLI